MPVGTYSPSPIHPHHMTCREEMTQTLKSQHCVLPRKGLSWQQAYNDYLFSYPFLFHFKCRKHKQRLDSVNPGRRGEEGAVKKVPFSPVPISSGFKGQLRLMFINTVCYLQPWSQHLSHHLLSAAQTHHFTLLHLLQFHTPLFHRRRPGGGK